MRLPRRALWRSCWPSTRRVVLALWPLATACLGQVSAPAGGAAPSDPGPAIASPPSAPVGEAFAVDVRVEPPHAAATVATGGVSPQSQPTFADVTPGTGPAVPLSGGTLLVLAGGHRAVASDPDRDHVFVADLDLGTLLKDITLGAGDQPGRAAEDGAGRIHVVLRAGGAIATVDPTTFALERRPVCPAPRGIAASGDGSVVYVACAGGELMALPAAGGPPSWTTLLDRDLRDVVVDRDGSLLVTTFRSARVFVVDDKGAVRDQLAPPVSLNLTRRQVTGREGAATTRFEPAVAWRTVARPGGGALMLHQRGYTGEVEASVGTAPVTGGYGGADICGGIVQTVVSAIDAGKTGKPSVELGGVLLGIDVALSTDDRVAVVSQADEFVRGVGSLVAVAPLGQVTSPSDSGCAQIAFAFSSAAPGERGPERPWVAGGPSETVANRLQGQAVAVGFAASGDVVVQMRQPAELRVPARGIRVTLSTDPRGDVGHAIFHSNAGAGIACASCHPEGGDDGRTWRFVDLGPRRTQSLRGGVSQTLPLHWDGDMQDVAQIAREVFTRRMGGPQLGSGDTEALVKWLDQIPMLPASPHADAATIARGQALFTSTEVGCASCHVGPRLTNNQTVDVGTGRPLQVPSLRGLAARAPFMHTGCAPTLGDRFSEACGGGRRHGSTAQLTPEQSADLTAYLESL
jgi:mono/diheme cytochrome c family protein